MKNESFEIELRGKVIALSLTLEDSITRIIHNFLYPRSEDKESIMIYFNEIIIPLSLNKKKDILKKILCTKRYKDLITPKLNKDSILGKENQFENYEIYCSFLIRNIEEIIKERNIVAHGYDFSYGFPSLAENGNIILANKTNMYKYSKVDIEEFSEKIEKLNYFLKLVHIEV